MADQCIVCLDSLDVEPSTAGALAGAVAPQDDPSSSVAAATAKNGSPGAAAAAAALQHADAALSVAPAAFIADGSSNTSRAASPGHHGNHEPVAQIQVCGHVLHDACLREWTEKANSCPICRQTFNLVHVYDKVGGTCLSTRKVEDRKQVAEFDAQAWLVENPEPEEDPTPCPICNLADNEEVLLLCDGCDAPYHTYCVDLDSVPGGSWYCMECSTAGIAAAVAPGLVNGYEDNVEQLYSVPRTQASVRQARRRARSDEWQGAWGRITGRVWDAINLDLDYQDDDEPSIFEGLRRSQQIRDRERRERERRENQRWQQRLNIASRVGAREVFARNIPRVLGRVTPIARPQRQESREAQMAWGALEKARRDENTEMESRKRKSRSGTAEPSEPQQEPERKLKRPRTRRLLPQNGESSSSVVNGVGSSSANHSGQASPPAAPLNAPEPPSFLSSLLREVEMSTPSDEEKIEALYGRLSGVNDAPSPPVASPSRASSSSPAPVPVVRPSSPAMTLSTLIQPVYPPANFSPTRSSSVNKHSRSSSPNRKTENHSSPENSDSEHRGRRNGASELQQPRPRRTHPVVVSRSEHVSPTRSEHASPTKALPLGVKESISGIVRSALKPHWKSSKLTTEQYVNINRDISQMLYKQVQDPNAINDDIRQSWRKLAIDEVDKAVAELITDKTTVGLGADKVVAGVKT
ncbi:hypothetical protein QBC47DRAFT_379394 [Echria macrotheca]|uniref:PHD and RING finger domain-containing protein n=1 Tax=Echria macrotheca TaxID=438768 RepID=A0AAJ0BDB4_9PEZI|nr:hypothetical protein QBC47DRAFT_379394 [Echria macrotheca]